MMKIPLFSPAQPRHDETRHSAGKIGASERPKRYIPSSFEPLVFYHIRTKSYVASSQCKTGTSRP